ncbi:MAG: ComF family protein [Alphaproteobacteria bacterium]|nr:ComF family protein [Alphaproteobacteria bacterium]MBF0128704.1 ComF family protein [Alphaproteobacteria bacterium]
MERAAIVRGVRGAGRRVLDLLLPPQCLGCGALVDEPGALCAACWEAIQFIGPPLCAVCGLPFELDPGPGAVCGACAGSPPPYRRARAVMRYDDASRDLILRFKHADRTDAAPAFGRWLARAGAGLLAETDVIAPVPLHRWRLFHRRYNQAGLLAVQLGKVSGVEASPALLSRRRHTPPQGGPESPGRESNVRGAFAVSRPASVHGRSVLLVDDVMTTGATLAECARELLRSGAREVNALVLARVMRE